MAYLGEEIGKLGFGLMRLPKKDGAIDVEQVKEMVDLFMAAGFNYFDTAWAYAGSEDAIRQALVERYPRESFLLATKNAAWLNTKTKEEALAQLDTSLKQTGAGYFDFYLLHNVGNDHTHVFEDYDLWRWGQGLKEKGIIRHLGFSFHSTPEELEEILTRHPEAEFVQLQINYADWESHNIQSRGVYEVARRFNKPVIIMEPVKGGLLANPPEPVKQIFREADPEASIASWALKYAMDLEGVITVLSGMSSVEQMKDNLASVKMFRGLNDEERAVIERAAGVLEKLQIIPCTSCNYCAKVCPMNIGISYLFNAMNLYGMYGNKEFAKNRIFFDITVPERGNADACVRCGQCEEACPQHIAIWEELEKIAEVFC